MNSDQHECARLERHLQEVEDFQFYLMEHMAGLDKETFQKVLDEANAVRGRIKKMINLI